MSLELPAELRWLGWVAGSAWPEGDEDKMWAVAADWRRAAAELRDLLPDLEAARRQTLAAYPWGAGREAMAASLDKLGSGPQSIAHLAEILDRVAESADGVGTEIQYTKWLIISTLGLLAVEIAAAWVFPPTAPAVEAAATVATRLAIRLLGERAVSFIARYAAEFGEHALVKFLAQHVVVGTAISVGQDLVLQEVQVLQGHRKGIDWNRIGTTACTAA
ncbi:WXG100-like domain-containing protein, partial [Nocardia gipuzkoensis]